jgi:catechol 2,3-dioxygenase-like lactoylglutathione lyase family enzyme
VAFYRNVLGFILVKRPHTFNETFEGAWLWGYGIGLHLIAGQPVPRSTRIDPRSDHLSFQVGGTPTAQAVPFAALSIHA